MYYSKYKATGNLTHAGTDKTVIAAFDYRKFRKKQPQEEAALRAREAAEYAALRARFHK